MRRILSIAVIAIVAVAFSTSADAKGKGKGNKKGPKAKIEKKIGKKADKVAKKAGKHDLEAVVEAHKSKGKGKGKGLDKGDAEPAATEDAAKPGPKGHAWGKDKKLNELRKHLKRLAKLKRLEEIATTSKNEKLLAKVQELLGKETSRHERVFARIDGKASAKDLKEKTE